MAYDTNPNYTDDIIYSKIRGEISKKCILWHGRAFSFFSSIQFVYYEKYVRNNGTWKITGESYQKQAASATSNIEAAIRKLPRGIQAELLIKRINDQRENICFFEDCFEMGVIYSIKIDVEEIFSKEYYTSVSQGVFIHAIEISDAFKIEAQAFYDRIKEKHIDIVERISGEIFVYFRGKDYCFDVYSDAISVGGYWQRRFEQYGMAALPSIKAVYGLAMAVIEFLAKGTQDKYQLLYNQHYISVKKESYAPSALQKW